MRKPRGIRNNNPLNIKAGDNWLGMEGVDEGGFVKFSAPEYGIRAAARILQTYHERRGIRRLRDVIHRWAPPSENDTSAYLASVAIWSGLDEDQELDLFDYSTVSRLLRAMSRMENGRPPDGTDPSWYDADTWERGLRMAGLVPHKPIAKSRTIKGAAVATGGVASAIGTLTGVFGVPKEIADMLPAALAALTNEQAASIILLISLAGAIYSAVARLDDKRKGRL